MRTQGGRDIQELQKSRRDHTVYSYEKELLEKMLLELGFEGGQEKNLERGKKVGKLA